MHEKSIDEMLDEIAQTLVERTNKVAENKHDVLYDIKLAVCIKRQRRLMEILSLYEETKKLVNILYVAVLTDTSMGV